VIWNTAKLGDVCFIQSGNSIAAKKKTELFTNVVGTPYIATKDVDFNGSINYKNGIYIPQEYVNSFKISQSGSTLVCAEGGSAGRKIAFSMNDCCFGNKLFSITPNSSLDAKYIYYYTLNEEFQSQFKAALHGLIGGVSLKKIKEFTISIPPLSEQQCIVAKLDAAFAEIDKSIEALSSNLIGCELLKLRCIRDEFTAPIAEHHLNFSDVCELKRGYDLPKRQRKKGKFPLFSANGITDYINESKIEAPGVVTGRSGTIGEVHYTDKDFWALNTALYVKNFKGNLPKYIFYFLKSFDLKSFSSGAGVPTLNRNVLSDQIVSINIKQVEQKRTIDKLDSIIDNIEKLKTFIYEKKGNYIALKSAILQQELKQSEAA